MCRAFDYFYILINLSHLCFQDQGLSAPNGRRGNARRRLFGGRLGRIRRVKFKLVCTNTDVSLCRSYKGRKFTPAQKET